MFETFENSRQMYQQDKLGKNDQKQLGQLYQNEAKVKADKFKN